MVRFRRNQSRLKPVNRIKHVVDSQFATALGAPQDVNLIQSTDTPTLAATNSCKTGSTVNGIYLDVEVISTSETGVLNNAYLTVGKDPGGNIGIINGNVVGSNDNKRYIIHQEMVMLDSESTTHITRTIMKGVIVIPRGYRRNGPNDLLVMRAFTPGGTAAWCVQCHYKEFR